MKKLLILLCMCLLSEKLHATTNPDNPFISACYYVMPDGSMFYKLVSSSNSVPLPGPYTYVYDWIKYYDNVTNNYVFSYGEILWYKGIVRDEDGVNWDYLFQGNNLWGGYFSLIGTNVPNPSNSSQLCHSDPNNCFEIVYTPTSCYPSTSDLDGMLQNNQLPNGAFDMKACACSPSPGITAGCYSQDQNGVYHVKLVVDPLLVLLSQSYPVFGGTISIWAPYGITGLTAGTLDPDGIHVDFYAVITPGPGDFDQNGCLKLYYSNPLDQSALYSNYGSTQSITLCQCCSSLNTSVGISTSSAANTIDYQSNMPVTWDFADGTTSSGTSGTHTYTSGGSYHVCANFTNADNSICEKCYDICITAPNITSTSGQCSVNAVLQQCNSNFTLTLDGHKVIATPVIPFVSYSSGYNEVPVWHFGSTTVNWNGTYIFAASGTYTVCLEIDLVDQNNQFVCMCSETCMDICIADTIATKPGGTSGTKNIPQDNKLTLAPNPTSDLTNLSFNLEKESKVKIIVTDAVGRVVCNVCDRFMNAGTQKVEITTANLIPGIYNVSVQTSSGIISKRLTVIK